MEKHIALELPIRSKLRMLDTIVQIIHYLHVGDRREADKLIEELKLRSTFLEEPIQHGVLMFSEQVHFQYDYDPWHKVTPEIELAANHLMEEMGFRPPES